MRHASANLNGSNPKNETAYNADDASRAGAMCNSNAHCCLRLSAGLRAHLNAHCCLRLSAGLRAHLNAHCSLRLSDGLRAHLNAGQFARFLAGLHDDGNGGAPLCVERNDELRVDAALPPRLLHRHHEIFQPIERIKKKTQKHESKCNHILLKGQQQNQNDTQFCIGHLAPKRTYLLFQLLHIVFYPFFERLQLILCV